MRLAVNDPACMSLYDKPQRPLQSACEAALTGLHCAWSVMAAIGVFMLGWALHEGHWRRVLHTAPIVVLSVLVLVGLPATARAQESPKADGAEPAKEWQNPVAALISMPLQHTWGVEPRRVGL